MKKYSSYQEAEAIKLLKDLMEKFPGKLYEIAWSLTWEYCLNGQYEKSLEMFDYGLARISHKKSTTMPNLPMAAALHSLRLLDVQTVRLRRLQSCALHPRAFLTSRYDFL
jgi:hypothetical protein